MWRRARLIQLRQAVILLWVKVQFSSVQDDIYAMRKPTLCAPPRLSEDFPTLPLKQFQYFKGRLDIGGEGQAVSK